MAATRSISRALARTSTRATTSLAPTAAAALPHLLQPRSSIFPSKAAAPTRRPFSHTPFARKDSAPSSSSQPPPPPAEADSPPDITAHDFASISALVSNPSPSRVIIDVREPAELAASGRVPGAQNVPINSAPDGLFLPADEFEDRFGFEKPSADTEVVFYCKAGVRSRAAARVAKMAGWQKVGEYPGSWMDWEKNGGEAER